jgi:hypothetical protein
MAGKITRSATIWLGRTSSSSAKLWHKRHILVPSVSCQLPNAATLPTETIIGRRSFPAETLNYNQGHVQNRSPKVSGFATGSSGNFRSFPDETVFIDLALLPETLRYRAGEAQPGDIPDMQGLSPCLRSRRRMRSHPKRYRPLSLWQEGRR